MSRNREVSMETTLYRGVGDAEVEIEVEITGTLEPFTPATYWQPAEGGTVVDVVAKHWKDGKGFDVPLTEAETATFEEQLTEQHLGDDYCGDD